MHIDVIVFLYKRGGASTWHHGILLLQGSQEERKEQRLAFMQAAKAAKVALTLLYSATKWHAVPGAACVTSWAISNKEELRWVSKVVC